MTHICVSKLTSIVCIGSDNGWTSAGILLYGPLVSNFSEILIEIYTLLFKKMCLKMSSGKWWPFFLGLNVLRWISERYPLLQQAPNPAITRSSDWHIEAETKWLPFYRLDFQAHFPEWKLSNKDSLKYVPKGFIANNLALEHIMTWQRTGHYLNQLPTHICANRPRWVKL